MSVLSPNLTVETFSDAVGVAFALAEEFAYVNAGLLLAPSGRPAALRLTKLPPFWALDPLGVPGAPTPVGPDRRLWPPGVSAGVDSIIWWLLRQPHRWPEETAAAGASGPGGRVLIVSVQAHQLGPATASQRLRYQRFRNLIGASGRDLLDWVETDGDCIRSSAYLDHPLSAWRSDAPLERWSEARQQWAEADYRDTITDD